jgi:glucose/arabinose dehydrogenase
VPHRLRAPSPRSRALLLAACLGLAAGSVLPAAAVATARSNAGAPAAHAAPAALVAGAAARTTSAAQTRSGSIGAAGGTTSSSRVAPHVVGAPTTEAFDATKVDLHLTLLKSGLNRPILVTHAGDGSGRRFVIEQGGKVRIIDKNGTLLSTPYIDITNLVATGNEQGLLGLAFHPHFETNGYFFLNYTSTTGATFINRYKATPTANTASRGTALRVMTISQPYANHNGGHMAFGPDGYLYIGMGDGGGSGDPGNRAQSLSSLHGKMLRIDIDHWANGKRYSVPSTNPYVGRTGLDEIWSRGLRNPWRWSWDLPTRRLFIADVGQSRYEEINRSNPTTTLPGGRAANYGWRQLEGRACYNPSTGCSTTGKTMPWIVYGHSVTGTDNCSVTGGYVYRGRSSPVLVGGYIYGDFCSGRIWVVSAGAYTPATGRLVHGPDGTPDLMISSFGQDEAGELYVCDLGGRIYRISATSL